MCEAYDCRENVLNIFLYKMNTTFRSFATYEQLVATYTTLYVHGVIVLNFVHCPYNNYQLDALTIIYS